MSSLLSIRDSRCTPVKIEVQSSAIVGSEIRVGDSCSIAERQVEWSTIGPAAIEESEVLCTAVFSVRSLTSPSSSLPLR